MTNQEPLFPKSNKEIVLHTLECYEHELNEKMQKTIDAITKKKEELEAIGKQLQIIRRSRTFVEKQMLDLEGVEVCLDPKSVGIPEDILEKADQAQAEDEDALTDAEQEFPQG